MHPLPPSTQTHVHYELQLREDNWQDTILLNQNIFVEPNECKKMDNKTVKDIGYPKSEANR